MNISKLDIAGAYYIEATRHADERGWFQEWFKKSDLQKHIDFDFTPVQANISRSSKGVVRGIHYSTAPQGQAKLVTVMQGSVNDYVVDLDPASETFGKWQSVNLDARIGNAIFLPPHVGHAFQSLGDDTIVSYLVSAEYDPTTEKGISPLCPQISIEWDNGLEIVMSDKDKNAPTLLDAFNL